MRPISELSAKDIQNLKIVCFDCDGVTVERGTDIEETETTLTVKTAVLSDRMLNKLLRLKKYYHLNFSSGRSLVYLERMYGRILWKNTSLQGEIGIFTLIDGRVIQDEYFTHKDLKIMQNIKNDIRALSRNDKRIRGFEPKQFLITVHCREEVPEINQILSKYDVEGRYYSWWNGEAYDIGLKRLNKGEGLRHLANYLKVNLKDTMAIGNGPNDRNMIDVAGISVTTDSQTLPADYYTSGQLDLGGEELIDKLLELNQ
jgi:HAD superfamily hydrolase (TIGR01484 family)